MVEGEWRGWLRERGGGGGEGVVEVVGRGKDEVVGRGEIPLIKPCLTLAPPTATL